MQTALADQDFRFIVDIVYKKCRIVIAPEKRQMVQGRLSKRVRALGLADTSAYVKLLTTRQGDGEVGELLNAISTNVTAFFREPHHFRHLANEVLPLLFRPGHVGKKLRIWSAGCSSGQEPYSIAMTVDSALHGRVQADVKILATDLDSHVLDVARTGRYSESLAEGIPTSLRDSYAGGSGNAGITISPSLRQLITFNQLNLFDDWPMQGPFDAVFCRNVVIYFDKPTQRSLFARIAELIAPRGWLYIGHSESLLNVSDSFELVGKTVYRKRS